MKFNNESEDPVRIKIIDKEEKLGFRWSMVKPNGEVDLPEKHGRAYKLTPVEKKEPDKKKGPLKKLAGKLKGKGKPSKDLAKAYKKKLLSVKGLGDKTVRDIMQVFPTEAHLKYAVKRGSKLPIRDDLEKSLREAFKK